MSHIEKYYGDSLCEVQFLAYAAECDDEGVYEFGGAQESLDHKFIVTVSERKNRG